MTIFIVSDTHWGHANTIKYCDRPFSSCEEMDEAMVERWNEVVTPQDKVYHLGDIYFGDGHKYLPRLNGKLRLVVGNHDNPKSPYVLNRFQKIMSSKTFGDKSVILTHIPIHEFSLFGGLRNIHGHIHQKVISDSRWINACVEHHGYTPVALDDLIAMK
jgi:calcineurin-like phosphoesterase family protein